jgi:hypothetical protein
MSGKRSREDEVVSMFGSMIEEQTEKLGVIFSEKIQNLKQQEQFMKNEFESIRQMLDSIVKKQDELYLLVKKVKSDQELQLAASLSVNAKLDEQMSLIRKILANQVAEKAALVEQSAGLKKRATSLNMKVSSSSQHEKI